MNYETAIANIRKELKTYITENKLQSLLIGISGGMDSCLCAALAKPVCDELKIPLMGRCLPTGTNKPDEQIRARMTGDCFCTDFKLKNLSDIYRELVIDMHECDILDAYDDDKKIQNGNMKARLRMIYLYNIASMNNGMVLSTDNYTEYLLGFWTLHGDVGDYGMIQELWKSEVYDMAEWIMNNECMDSKSKETLLMTIDALATDGLGVTDHGDLGQIMPEWKGNSRDGYKEVDKILQAVENISVRNPHHELDNNPVIKRHLNTEFKRNNPINIIRDVIIKPTK